MFGDTLKTPVNLPSHVALSAPTRTKGLPLRAPKAQGKHTGGWSTVRNIYLTHKSGPTAKNYPRSSHSWPKIQWKIYVPIAYMNGRSRNTHLWLTMAADRNIHWYTHHLCAQSVSSNTLCGETPALAVISILHTFLWELQWVEHLNYTSRWSMFWRKRLTRTARERLQQGTHLHWPTLYRWEA